MFHLFVCSLVALLISISGSKFLPIGLTDLSKVEVAFKL